MAAKKPRLFFSELSGNVYVVTRYTERPHPRRDDRTIVLAHVKHDVTEDFDAAAPLRRKYLASRRRAVGKVTRKENRGG